MTPRSAHDRIAASPLFDADWYVARYAHVRQSGQDPAAHYLLVGAHLGYNPGPGFDTAGYLAANPDVAEAGVNPLLHFEQFGRREGRSWRGSLPCASDTIKERLQAMLDATSPGLGFSAPPAPALRTADQLADYAILTPTGDRAAFFNRCLHMVLGQSLQPREWIIVDDGRIPLNDQMVLPDWATHVRRTPAPQDPPHSLSVNLPAALAHVTCDRVLIFEDDDWYAPLYAEYLLPLLDELDLVGLSHVRYYLLRAGMWKSATLPHHTAFAQSAFRRGHAWDHLLAVCATNFPEVRERGVLDRYWWHSFEGRKRLVPDHPGLHLGIKGGFGRAGLAEGHRTDDPGYGPDGDGAGLRRTLGPDIAYYRRWQNRWRRPYALYTTVSGTDPLPDPPPGAADLFDLYAFCDRDLPPGSPWEAIPFDTCAGDPALRVLRPRVLPHLYFPDYEWSLWIDPAAPPASSVGTWIAAAIKARTPLACPASGLTALVRRHTDPDVARAMTLWWQDILTGQQSGEGTGLTQAAKHVGLTTCHIPEGGLTASSIAPAMPRAAD